MDIDIKETIELIALLSPITGLFSKYLFNQITINPKKNRTYEKIQNIKDIDYLLDRFDNDFKDNFVLKNFKEHYFFLQTGIETNEKSIKNFIDFKDLLGGNYTWSKIRSALPYYRFKEDKIIIHTNLFLRIFAPVVNILSFVFFLIGLIIIAYFAKDIPYFSFKDYLKLSLLSIFPMLSALYLLKIITPLNIAIGMQKKLAHNN